MSLQLLVRDRPAGDRIRGWTPACSADEEAYSVAMLLTEHSERARVEADLRESRADLARE